MDASSHRETLSCEFLSSFIIIIILFYIWNIGGSSRCLVAYLQNCYIVVCDFELLSHYFTD